MSVSRSLSGRGTDTFSAGTGCFLVCKSDRVVRSRGGKGVSPQGLWRQSTSENHDRVNADDRLLLSVTHMEMWRSMVIVVHGNDHPKEDSITRAAKKRIDYK